MAADLAQQIMSGLKMVESGNNYTAHSKSSTASGAYQYLDTTWNHYGGYLRAADAPAAVQDQKAYADITNKLKAYGGNVRAVIQSWFYPAGVGHDSLVPPGNAISLGQYADRVQRAMGMPVTAATYSTTPAKPSAQGQVSLSPQTISQLTLAGQRLAALGDLFNGAQNPDPLGLNSLTTKQQGNLPNALGMFGTALNSLMYGQQATTQDSSGATSALPATADAASTTPQPSLPDSAVSPDGTPPTTTGTDTSDNSTVVRHSGRDRAV